MESRTVIICPELAGGGVGDYTRQLLHHLPRVPDLRLVIPKIGSRSLRSFEGYSVEETASTTGDLCGRLPQVGGKVLVQYSAYGFSAYGYPRWLIKALIEWKKQSRGFLGVMFHEIWTFWPIWNKNYLLQNLHRRDLGQLLQVADAVFTSTPSQAEHLTALSPQCAVQVLPVGTNVRVIESNDEEREPGAAVLFGLQRLRIRTLKKMLPELKALAAAGVITKVVTAGAGRSTEGDDQESALLMDLDLSNGFDQRGPLPEEKISEQLSTSAFGISAQDELSIMKSSTLMAYAAHGLNVISCYANPAKREPLSIMIAPDELLKGIAEPELRSRSEKFRQWQERTSSWPNIANHVARVMRW